MLYSSVLVVARRSIQHKMILYAGGNKKQGTFLLDNLSS
jgi:hypothetical protein